MSGKAAYIPFYTSDFLGGTGGMTAATKGIYITLLCLMYDAEVPLTQSWDTLARRCGCTLPAFKKTISTLEDDGKITLSDTGIWSEKCDKHLTQRRERQKSATSSAKIRWEKEQQKQGQFDANAFPAQCYPEPEPELNTPLPPSKGEPAKPQKKSRSRQNQIDRPQDVPEQLWSDFLTIRKQKRAPVTQTALDGFRREAAKANITIAQAITISLERGWQGFRADWVKPEDIRSAQPPEPPAAPPVEVDGRKITRSSVVRLIREHFETGDWSMQARSVFGPPPGQPGCKVPADVIQEARGENLIQFPGVAAA